MKRDYGLLAGIAVSIFAEIVLFVFTMLFANFIYDDFLASIVLILDGVILLGLLIYSIVLIAKKKSKFGIGILIGLFIPLLIFGSCVLIFVLSY